MPNDLRILAQRNPYDISGKKANTLFSQPQSRVGGADTPPTQAPTVADAKSFLQAKRTAFAGAWAGARAHPTAPVDVGEDVGRAKAALDGLAGDNKKAFAAFLLNVVREASLTHREAHAPLNHDALANDIVHDGAMVGHDHAQQAQLLIDASRKGTLGKGTHFSWDGVHINLGDPRHMTRTIVDIRRKADNYPALHGVIKDIRNTLNKAPYAAQLRDLSARTKQQISVRDINHVIAAPTAAEVETRFRALFANPDGLNIAADQVLSKHLNELKGISFLMYALEPARDPVALPTNLLAEALTRKGMATTRHFVHSAGMLGVLTPRNISNDEKPPTVGKAMPARAHGAHPGDARLTVRSGLQDAPVHDLKAQRTLAVIETLVDGIQNNNWRQDNPFEPGEQLLLGRHMRTIGLKTGELANAVGSGDAAAITRASESLRDTFVEFLNDRFQPMPVELAQNHIRAGRFENVVAMGTTYIDNENPELACSIAEVLAKAGRNDDAVRIAEYAAGHDQPAAAGIILLQAGRDEDAQRLAVAHRNPDNWQVFTDICLSQPRTQPGLGTWADEILDSGADQAVKSRLVVGMASRALEQGHPQVAKDLAALAHAHGQTDMAAAIAEQAAGRNQFLTSAQILIACGRTDSAGTLAQARLDAGDFVTGAAILLALNRDAEIVGVIDRALAAAPPDHGSIVDISSQLAAKHPGEAAARIAAVADLCIAGGNYVAAAEVYVEHDARGKMEETAVAAFRAGRSDQFVGIAAHCLESEQPDWAKNLADYAISQNQPQLAAKVYNLPKMWDLDPDILNPARAILDLVPQAIACDQLKVIVGDLNGYGQYGLANDIVNKLKAMDRKGLVAETRLQIYKDAALAGNLDDAAFQSTQLCKLIKELNKTKKSAEANRDVLRGIRKDLIEQQERYGAAYHGTGVRIQWMDTQIRAIGTPGRTGPKDRR